MLIWGKGEKGVLKVKSILFYLIFIAGKNCFALRSSPLKEIEDYVLMNISMINDGTWFVDRNPLSQISL